MKIPREIYQWVKGFFKKSAEPSVFHRHMDEEDNFSFDIEQLLCFERAARFCYASVEMMVHNRTLRHQCQSFTKWSRTHEEELERMLKESASYDPKLTGEHRPYVLPSDDLTLESVLSLGSAIAKHRLEGYQELRKYLSLKNRIVVNHFIAQVIEEVKFFEREKEMVSVEDILNSMN